MFIVIYNRVYSATPEAGTYYLVSIAVDAVTGAVTVTAKDEGITELPARYSLMTLEEVIAKFDIAAYKPPATLAGNDPVTIYLDETNKQVTITATKPSTGTFSDHKSDDTDIATVTASGGTLTIVPVAVGKCNVSIKFTPTDTDFGAVVATIPVTVERRQIKIDQVRNQQLKKNTTKDIVLTSNVSGVAYTVLSSDTGICGVSETSGTVTLAPAETAPLGVAIITVSATLASGKADDSDVMKFRVRGCDDAVSITPVGPTNLEAGKTKAVTVACAGAEIREVSSADPAKVEVEKTGKLEITLTGKGTAGQTADITVYCDKRGYGEDDDTFTVTLT